MSQEKIKKSVFETPLLSTKVKSANAKIFPEGALGYFIGPTLALLTSQFINKFYNRYLSDVLNMNVWANTFLMWLPIISVVFVILGNFIVGRLMDRNRTKAGKARPLLLISVPISILALLMMFVFSPFPEGASESAPNWASLICIAIGYNLWYGIAYPCYFTSHSSLVNLSTRNGKHRSLLATISNATSLAAIGLISMVMPLFQSYFFTENAQTSYNIFRIFVIALIAITTLGALIEYYFTRERVTEESFVNKSLNTTVKATPLKQQAKICLKDKFWWIMIALFFFYQLGGIMKNSAQSYYCVALFSEADSSYDAAIKAGGIVDSLISTIGAIPTALGMVLAWPISNKIGKGKTILCGAILAAFGGALGIMFPADPYIAVTAFVIKSLGSTPAMYLSLAMLADMLDHQEAMHGVRTDGLTMTIYGAIMAMMAGISYGVINAVSGALGYDTGLTTGGIVNVNSPELCTAYTWLFFGVDMIGYIVIALMFIFMNVEKFSKFDKKAIVKDQKAKAEAEGKQYINPADKLKQEEAEAEAASEEARKAELKARCEKKGISFEKEESEYQKAQAQKQAAAEAKKAAAEARKAEAQKAKEAQFNALSEEQKASVLAKQKAKAEKQAQKDARTLEEFNKLRVKNGQPVLEAE